MAWCLEQACALRSIKQEDFSCRRETHQIELTAHSNLLQSPCHRWPHLPQVLFCTQGWWGPCRGRASAAAPVRSHFSAQGSLNTCNRTAFCTASALGRPHSGLLCGVPCAWEACKAIVGKHGRATASGTLCMGLKSHVGLLPASAINRPTPSGLLLLCTQWLYEAQRLCEACRTSFVCM